MHGFAIRHEVASCKTKHGSCDCALATPGNCRGSEKTFWINLSSAVEYGSAEDVARVGELLLEAIAAAQDCLDSGGCVLVHCLNGWHRTGLFIIGLLVLRVVHQTYSYLYAHLGPDMQLQRLNHI